MRKTFGICMLAVVMMFSAAQAAAPDVGIRIVVLSGNALRKPLLGDQVASEHTVIVVRAEGVDPLAAVQWSTGNDLSVVRTDKDTEIHVAGAPGTYSIGLETIAIPDPKAKPIWQRTSVKLTILGKGPLPPTPIPPGPIPPTPPTPPVPPAPPAPIVGPGLRVMIVEESGDRTALPTGQQRALSSVVLRTYVRSKSKEAGNFSNFRLWDKDEDLSTEGKEWQDAFNAVKASKDFATPWLVISDGKTGTSVPLPKTFEETLALVKKYGG